MDNNKNTISERILNLTVEIINLLMAEEYLVVKASTQPVTSGNYPRISEEFNRTQSPMKGTQSPMKGTLLHSPKHNSNKNQEILNLINRIADLLTGEVPIRCQDITVHFSMEEWEYIEGHKDLYRDVMMEDHQTPSPEEGPSHLYSQDRPKINHNVPKGQQDEGLVIVKVEEVDQEEKYVWQDQQCKEEEIPANISPADGCQNTLNGHLVLSPKFEMDANSIADYIQDSRGENSITPIPVLSISDLCHMKLSCDKSNIVRHNPSQHRKTFSCPECGKCFIQNAILTRHLKMHTGEKPFVCFECGKRFTRNQNLLSHQRLHRRIKPFPCAECGERFNLDSDLKIHQRTHRGEQCYMCVDYGKPFIEKYELINHEAIHLDENMFSCSECGRCFSCKTFLVTHQRTHWRETIPVF